MTEAGCQPPWRRFSVEGLPLCNNFTLLAKNFGATYTKYYIDITDREGIIAETGCLMPCSFMEYKVSGMNNSLYFKFLSNCIYFFLVD